MRVTSMRDMSALCRWTASPQSDGIRNSRARSTPRA
jgi:hypothetical protein